MNITTSMHMPKSRVLLAMEHGANRGHVERVRPVVQHLLAQGEQVALACPPRWAEGFADLQGAASLSLKPQVPTPITPLPYAPDNHAEWLAVHGFASPQALGPALAWWQQLLAQVQPAYVVLDTAPVAHLAAYLNATPAIKLGNGFEFPTWPPQSWRGVRHLGERSVATTIHQISAAVASATGRPFGTEHWLGYWAHPTNLVYGGPAVDPFAQAQRPYPTQYVQPPGHPGRYPAPNWPSLGAPAAAPTGGPPRKCLAYVNSPALANAIHEAFANLSGWQVLVVAPNAANATAAIAESTVVLPSGSGIRLQCTFVDIAQALAQANLVISYGSLGVTALAAQAGVFQVLLPADVEKALTAKRLHQQGMALAIKGKSHELGEVLLGAIRQADSQGVLGGAPGNRGYTKQIDAKGLPLEQALDVAMTSSGERDGAVAAKPTRYLYQESSKPRGSHLHAQT